MILRKIVYISILHGHNSPNHTIYATPGQAWLSEHTGYHRVTVSRRVTYLEEKGFLAITYRRKVKGQWQTNLYRFGRILWGMIKHVTQRYRLFFHRVTPMLHIVSLREQDNTKKGATRLIETDFDALLTRIKNKLFLSDVSPPET
jgi:hypothetical protein